MKADTLPLDQTDKAEDFRIPVRKHLPLTTFSPNLQDTTLKSAILGLLTCFSYSQGPESAEELPRIYPEV